MGQTTNGEGPANGAVNGFAGDPILGTKGPEAAISLALSPNDPANIEKHAQKIAQLAKESPADNNDTRLELLNQARSLAQALETPRETMIRHCWAEPTAYMALTLGVRIGLFNALLEEESQAKSVATLASQLGIQEALLARVMKHISAMGYLIEVGKDEYMPTNFAKSLTIPTIGQGYPCLAGCAHFALTNFPAFAAQNGYQEPNTAKGGVWQKAHGTELDFFSFVKEQHPLDYQFGLHMGGYRQGRRSWMDDGFFPVEQRLIKGAKSSEGDVLLVDQGGSLGHDISEFHKKHPLAPGRLVLQDLPSVIAQAKDLDSKIEATGHDFFTEQPVKGARAYYMHSVLHDWPDELAEQILKTLKPAMEPGYSKLLINENLIPNTNAHWETTALDLMMMTLVSAKERTESQWRHLIEERAGLKIINIWGLEIGNGVESLIECELA